MVWCLSLYSNKTLMEILLYFSIFTQPFLGTRTSKLKLFANALSNAAYVGYKVVCRYLYHEILFVLFKLRVCRDWSMR